MITDAQGRAAARLRLGDALSAHGRGHRHREGSATRSPKARRHGCEVPAPGSVQWVLRGGVSERTTRAASGDGHRDTPLQPRCLHLRAWTAGFETQAPAARAGWEERVGGPRAGPDDGERQHGDMPLHRRVGRGARNARTVHGRRTGLLPIPIEDFVNRPSAPERRALFISRPAHECRRHVAHAGCRSPTERPSRGVAVDLATPC